MVLRYNPRELEKKWQQRWDDDKLYEAKQDSSRPKWYELTMYPYTSGNLHIGHWYAMAPADAHARFKRMQGYNVLHPMGFDAFGLPAENAAINRGIHPHTWTMDNVENMRRQLRRMGAIYDWDREVITSLPEYYKWTQWLFLKLYHAGLAYRAEAPANWCPNCQTTLANEQVLDDGTCERCHTAVTRKDLEQWFFRITRYADELLDTSKIQWPERINVMQANWIGRSEGAEIAFGIEEYGLDEKEIRVFTTRPDTVFGVTFMVLAPEHPLVPLLTTPDLRDEVNAYIEAARRQSEIERLSTEKEQTGVFIGAYCTNKLSGDRVPIYIADYVLLTYGTGAVMGVPAHDTRDFSYATRYDILIRTVIAPEGWRGDDLEEAYLQPGVMVNSGPFDGLPSQEGKQAVIKAMEEQGIGGGTVSYRLRDWLISRQRYWGAPIPMVYCQKCGVVAVPEEDLPVLLPEDAEFRPTGESPLTYHQEFANTTCPECGSPARRETDTMDTFMCSSWYFLRFASPKSEDVPFRPEDLKYWLPVDQYTGGAEHAVMHLLYARFFVKALRDIGLLDFDEPFLRLFNQGTIINERQKMSKSRGNVITPDEYVDSLGADVIRAYLMFIGPWDQGGEWVDQGLNGITRWYNRAWDMVLRDAAELDGRPTDDDSVVQTRHLLHKTIKKVTQDLEGFRFNTTLASLMSFTNHLGKVWEDGSVDSGVWRESIKTFLLLLAPIAPHLAEEMWSLKGYSYSIHNQSFPKWDEALAAEKEITLVLQVNGKVRDRVTVPASVTEEEAKELAMASDRVKAHLKGRKLSRVIYVPGRLVNIVAR
ncbi:MAG: leucine--tRNA ligase [Chloroflexi bacterium]|nr:leucine--tRNA ligase [Chloroflexota bacterium]